MLHSNAMFCLLPALRDWDRAGEGKHKSSQSVGREAKHCQMQSLQYTSEASRVIEAGTETPSLSSRPTAQWSFLYNFVQKLLMPQTPLFCLPNQWNMIELHHIVYHILIFFSFETYKITLSNHIFKFWDDLIFMIFGRNFANSDHCAAYSSRVDSCIFTRPTTLCSIRF